MNNKLLQHCKNSILRSKTIDENTWKYPIAGCSWQSGRSVKFKILISKKKVVL